MNIKDEAFSGGGHIVILGAGASIASTIQLFFMTSNLLGFEKILEVKWKLDEDDGNGFVLASN